MAMVIKEEHCIPDGLYLSPSSLVVVEHVQLVHIEVVVRRRCNLVSIMWILKGPQNLPVRCHQVVTEGNGWCRYYGHDITCVSINDERSFVACINKEPPTTICIMAHVLAFIEDVPSCIHPWAAVREVSSYGAGVHHHASRVTITHYMEHTIKPWLVWRRPQGLDLAREWVVQHGLG